MLQKCYEFLCRECINTHMSNPVTKSAIVQPGAQKRHCQNWAKPTHAHAHAAYQSRPGANKRADKLEKAGLLLLLLAGTLAILAAYARTESWERAASWKRAESYSLYGVIESVNYEEDYITIIDNSGNAWEWENVEDWQENDVAVMTINSNGTKEITDDIIMNIKYTGWVE